jgi:hypothetical protein
MGRKAMTTDQLKRILEILEPQYPGQGLPLAEADSVQVEGQPKPPRPTKNPGPSNSPGKPTNG